MSVTPRRDTRAELEIRRILHRHGLRYRTDQQVVEGLRRRADILFKKQRIAIFIDGCFWHGCAKHGTWPKNNATFWREKIAANQSRDRDTDQKLRAEGWCVLRIWEHEDSLRAAYKIIRAVDMVRAGKGR